MSDPLDFDESPAGLHDRVLAALRAQPSGTPLLQRVSRACTELLLVDGISISVMGGTQHRETLFATDEVIGRVEDVQFSLGEGPCFEAFHTRGPVLVDDFPGVLATRWPVFAAEMAGREIGAIFAFPLQSGGVRIGAMDLYRRRPGRLTAIELATASEIVDLVTVALMGLRRDSEAGVHGRDDEWLVVLSASRARVHQATGMLIVALGITADQALARLRGHAFATGRLADDVAADIVARRLPPSQLNR